MIALSGCRASTVLAMVTAIEMTVMLAGCADLPPQAPKNGEVASRPASIPVSQLLKRPSEFYTDDGPDGAAPVDLDRVPDALPRAEPLHASANEPYSVFGRDYAPMKAPGAYKRQGTASWYGRKYHGQRTASGEVYDMYTMSAAHPTLPIPSYARVTNLANRASVVVRINDRGPFASGRIMDVSYAAAHRLGFVQSGSAQVEVESLVPAGLDVAARVEPPAPAGGPAQRQEYRGTAGAAAATESAANAAKEPPIPVTSERGGIYLQLGAFSVRANAENFQSRVATQLESIAAQVAIDQHGPLHRVQLGPFKDRRAANAAAERVRALLDVKPVVVVR